ncbi:hypothetical protein HCN44_010848, partial [Aphidius gifuensis]
HVRFIKRKKQTRTDNFYQCTNMCSTIIITQNKIIKLNFKQSKIIKLNFKQNKNIQSNFKQNKILNQVIRIRNLLKMRKHRAILKHRLENTISTININNLINNRAAMNDHEVRFNNENVGYHHMHQHNQDDQENDGHQYNQDDRNNQENDPNQHNQDDQDSHDGDTDHDDHSDEEYGNEHIDQGSSSETDNEDLNVNNPDQNREQAPEIELLRKWAVQCKIPHVHLTSLLIIMRQRLLPELPHSSKTFLGTTRATYHIVDMQDADRKTIGKFTYLGVEQGLKKYINTAAHETGTVELQFNCDGLPLSHSSCKTAWPILCKVHNHLAFYEPFVVAIYVGRSKPFDLQSYLRQFIEEMNKLLDNGFILTENHYEIKIHSFICDTPARALLKEIAGHTGFYSCERCDTSGTRVDNTTVFPDIGNPRTNELFRKHDDVNHHIRPSPLLMIRPTIDMVQLFVLDFMHSGFLGVMSKLLEYWFSDQSKVSRRLQLIQKQIHFEFSRKIRTLLQFSRYKATELKFFVFYVEPIILKNMISDDQYKHFSLFHFASKLLWCRKTALVRANINKASNLLQTFFNNCKECYTDKSTVMNMHNMYYVAEDVINLRCSLSEMTAFPFENALGKIKRMLRSPTHTVTQLCRRIHEHGMLNDQAKLIHEIEIIKENNYEIKKLKYRGSLLTSKAPDNMALLENTHIFEIEKIYHQDGNILIEGLRWPIKNHVYEYPEMKSGQLNLWEIQKPTLNNMITISLQDIKIKMIMLTLNFD